MLPPMAREEQQKLLASGLVQGEAKKAMPSTNDDAAGVALPPSPCDYCSGMPAVVYCRADSARLCLPCDRHVHGANTVSSSHARAPLCAVCRAAVAAFRRAARFLCSNCDFEKHRDGAAQGEPLHDRGTVEGYTGCPSLSELAAILGVDECEKSANEGWWSVWEEPQVLSLDDVIVPTTSCHGLQPLVTAASPKVGSNSTGKKNYRSLQIFRISNLPLQGDISLTCHYKIKVLLLFTIVDRSSCKVVVVDGTGQRGGCRRSGCGGRWRTDPSGVGGGERAGAVGMGSVEEEGTAIGLPPWSPLPAFVEVGGIQWSLEDAPPPPLPEMRRHCCH